MGADKLTRYLARRNIATHGANEFSNTTNDEQVLTNASAPDSATSISQASRPRRGVQGTLGDVLDSGSSFRDC